MTNRVLKFYFPQKSNIKYISKNNINIIIKILP
jgi:hypothetical protein